MRVVVIVPSSSSAPAEDSPEMDSLDSPAAVRETLRAIAGNLWFTWLPGARALFEDLDPERFAALDHNPTALVAELSDEKLARGTTPDYLERLARVRAAIDAEVDRRTWWERRGERVVAELGEEGERVVLDRGESHAVEILEERPCAGKPGEPEVERDLAQGRAHARGTIQ